MADATRPALGLSIGATNLAAVTADRAVTRKPVLTLYGQRPPEVGVPSENPNLDEPGLVITDFVNRMGSPARVVAADGSTHRSEALVADALRALGAAATGGQPLAEAVVVSYPAHWQPPAVGALRAALGPGSGWLQQGEPVLVDDAAAAVFALQTNPGLPTTGVIAVCDFGGSGSSLTLVDAASGYQRIGATVRHDEFSGDMIDQALLTHIVAELSASGSFDTSSTSAIGSLTRLRADCRLAKEQLSAATVATLTVELPGFHGDVHLTRAELDDEIRQPLDGFLTIVRNALQSNGIQATDVAAVAAVGGGANIAAVTTTLSDQLRLPVVTAPRPHLTAAIGAALQAAHGSPDQPATALAPAVEAVPPVPDPTTVLQPPPESSAAPALAWSEAGDDTGITPLMTGEYPPQPLEAEQTPLAAPAQYHPDAARDEVLPVVPWYRRPPVLVIGAALVLLAIAAAIMMALRHTGGGAPATPAPSISTGPASTSAPASSGSQSPTGSQPSDTNQPPSSSTESSTAPTSAETTTTPPSSSTQSSTTPSTSQVTTTQPPFTPNRPILPVFPRNPGSPQEPGLGGR